MSLRNTSQERRFSVVFIHAQSFASSSPSPSTAQKRSIERYTAPSSSLLRRRLQPSKRIHKPQLRDSGVTMRSCHHIRGENPWRPLSARRGSSVWDIWPSQHSSCRGARWGLILLNRCGRKLGWRLVWLNCGSGCRRYLIRLSGSGCRLHLIQLNRRRLIRLNSGIGRCGHRIRLDGRGRRLRIIQFNSRRLVWLN